jgi:riboflavin biosynthesis pyrimidine reductase
VRRIHPGPEADLTEDELGTAYAFPDRRPWVRANMVSTLDGTMRGPDGSSRSISTPADQRVFRLARRDADVVLVGAGTIRAEDYRPSVRTVAIVTRRLDLPLTLRMFTERTPEHARPIAFTTDAAAASAPAALRDVIDIVGCGADTVHLPRVINDLRDRGLGRILCEGGPALLGDLISAGLLDELLLTLVPSLLGGGPREHILDIAGGLEPALRLVPRLVLEEEGTVLLQLGRP